MDINKYNPELPIKGLNLDVEPEKQPQSTYRFALNVLNDSEDGSLQSVVAEPGNTPCFELDDGFNLIGTVSINAGDTVLISYNETTGVSQVGTVDSVCTYTKLIESDCFTFNSCRQVKGEFKVRNGCERIITLYDCFSSDLYINLDDLQLYYSDDYITYLESNPNDTPDDYFIATGFYAWDCNKLKLNPDLSYPCIEYDSIVEGGGNVEIGTYKFKLELLDTDFNRLGFTNYTPPVPIIDDSLGSDWLKVDGAANIDVVSAVDGGKPRTRNSIQLNVTDISSPVSYLRLAVKYYNNSDGITAGFVLKSQYIDVRGTDNTQVEFQGFDSSSDLPITEAELIVPKQVYNTSCAQEQINGRLVRANLTEERIDWSAVQQAANTIGTQWATKGEEAENAKGANSKFPEYYALNRSYMRDEIYAFAIVLKFTNGTYSPAFHIPGRQTLTRADLSPYTGVDIITEGNSINHQRNQVPITEDEWDLQLLEVTPNPDPSIAWVNGYNQHVGYFDPEIHVIYDNVEHLGLSDYTDNVLGYGIGPNGGALIPRWRVFNTAIRLRNYQNPFEVSDDKQRGYMSYYQSETRYPAIRDCDGNFIYPTDPTDPTKTAYIRHHKFPDAGLSVIYNGVVNSLPPFNTLRTNIIPMGVLFDTTSFYAALPPEILDQVEGHIFVRADRTDNQKTVIDKGLYSVAIETWENGTYLDDRIAGTFIDPYYYTPVHFNSCTGTVGTFISPKLLAYNQYYGSTFTLKNESAIRVDEITNTTDPDLQPNLWSYDATNFVTSAYEFFDLRSYLGFPYCTVQQTPWPDQEQGPFGEYDIVPHYRAKFVNRRVENSRILPPETNVAMSINVLNTGYSIFRFKNVWQSNPVMIFENETSLPRGILKSIDVFDPDSEPDANNGQAGYNMFYVAVKNQRDVYNNLTSLSYFPISKCCEEEFAIPLGYTEPLFGGDIFISRFTFTKYSKGEGEQRSEPNLVCTGLEPAPQTIAVCATVNVKRKLERRNQVITTYVESDVNANLRHSGDGSEDAFSNKYYEKDFDSDIILYLPYFRDDEAQEYFGYNRDYSVVSNEDRYTPISETFDFCLECSSDYPNRIAWSPQSFETELADTWKINNVNDFLDISARTGEVTNLKFDRNQLLILTDESLYMMIPNPQQLQTDIDSIQVGTGDFLSIPPREYTKKAIGYAGNQGRFNAVATEHGWTWVDQREGRVFNHTGQGLQEISRNGMYHWFKENLPSFLEKDLKRFGIEYDCLDNTANVRGIGLQATYDPRFERYILHKSDYAIAPGVDFQGLEGTSEILNALYYNIRPGTDNEIVFSTWNGAFYQTIELSNQLFFQLKSWTMSYSYKYQSWTSWHSYQPNFMYFDNTHFYSYIANVPGFLENSIYKHGERNYHTYYGTRFPFVAEFVVKNINTTDLHNVYWYSRMEVFDNTTQRFIDVDDIPFDRMLVYNDKQSTGELRLNLKTEDEDNLDFDLVNRTVVKTDNNCRVSLLRDIYDSSSLFDSNWNNVAYSSNFNTINGYQGYIDKVPATTTLPEQEFLKDIKGKYAIVRLSYVDFPADPTDYKRILHLAQTAEFNSMR